jgi:hypothetical protein
MAGNPVNPGGMGRDLLEGGGGKTPAEVSHSGEGQPPADGIADEGGRLVDVQLVHEPDPVGLDGLDAQFKAPGNLLRGLALSDEL